MDTTLIFDTFEFIKVHADGSVERFTPTTAPASLDLYNGYKCKDVSIDTLKPITARIFIPSTPTNDTFPVLVYFHGGGFCIGSTTWLGYHHFLGDLCDTSKCIVLSVDYRLAPEYKLPIAYEDSYTSLIWLSQQKQIDSWLQNADLSRVFLSGDSAGGNIAHHVALRAIRDNECPDGLNRDYDYCNLEKMEVSMSEWSRFPNVLVFVAELDFLKERGVTYAEFLKKKVSK